MYLLGLFTIRLLTPIRRLHLQSWNCMFMHLFVCIYTVCTLFSLCRTYTDLFEPIVIDDEEDVEDLSHNKKNDLPPEEPALVI